MGLFARKPEAPTAPAEAATAIDDENPPGPTVAELEAELEAADAAAENGDSEGHRDRRVIADEIHTAKRAARMAASLGTGDSAPVTRKEFEQHQFATAAYIVGIEAALCDPMVKPRDVLNTVLRNADAIGLSRAQAKELDGFRHRIDVVRKHYGDWDTRTSSQRAYAERAAAMRRPRLA